MKKSVLEKESLMLLILSEGKKSHSSLEMELLFQQWSNVMQSIRPATVSLKRFAESSSILWRLVFVSDSFKLTIDSFCQQVGVFKPSSSTFDKSLGQH